MCHESHLFPPSVSLKCLWSRCKVSPNFKKPQRKERLCTISADRRPQPGLTPCRWLAVPCMELHYNSQCFSEMEENFIDLDGWVCQARRERKRRDRMEKLAKEEAISAEVGP